MSTETTDSATSTWRVLARFERYHIVTAQHVRTSGGTLEFWTDGTIVSAFAPSGWTTAVLVTDTEE